MVVRSITFACVVRGGRAARRVNSGYKDPGFWSSLPFLLPPAFTGVFSFHIFIFYAFCMEAAEAYWFTQCHTCAHTRVVSVKLPGYFKKSHTN